MFEGGTGEPDSVSGDVRARQVEGCHGVEPALSFLTPEEVGSGNPDILEDDGAGVRGALAHGVLLLPQTHPFPGGFDDER